MFSTADPLSARRAGVLGLPIAHSLSPVMHRAGYAALGLNWRYDAIECDAAALPALVQGWGAEWAGVSVTMPGKAAAAQMADQKSARVQLLGVANTLVRTDHGWLAENTDVDGVVGALRAAGVTAPHRVLLIGGGGTALAAVAGLHELGVAELLVAGRRVESTQQALALAASLGMNAEHVPWEGVGAHAQGLDVVMSTVPAGAADQFAADLAAVPALFDAIYHPWPTPLAAAGVSDRITVTGLDMLLHQAFAQFRLMTGQAAPRQQMREALKSAAGVHIPLPI
nr:shikimate dehydrogenase [Nakamurella antarctica]